MSFINITFKPGARQREFGIVKRLLENSGYKLMPVGKGRDSLVFKTSVPPVSGLKEKIATQPGVKKAQYIPTSYLLASKNYKPESSTININNSNIGNGKITVFAGPCAVESRQQVLETAIAVKELGVTVLRGGIFKPRTSPYNFQGLGKKGLEYLLEAKEHTGLDLVVEVMQLNEIAPVAEVADLLQVGSRNMQNYPLLKALGQQEKPVLLKRGMGCSLNDLLMSAEYILSGGNSGVILCERGIKTFSDFSRNTFDINAIPALKLLSHLPVIGDPSHGTGVRELVGPVGLAALAAGADGIMVEVHPNPEKAKSDGHQSLTVKEFQQLMLQVQNISAALNRPRNCVAINSPAVAQHLIEEKIDKDGELSIH